MKFKMSKQKEMTAWVLDHNPDSCFTCPATYRTREGKDFFESTIICLPEGQFVDEYHLTKPHWCPLRKVVVFEEDYS